MNKGKKETVYVFILSLISKLVTYFLLLVLANYYIVSSYGRVSYVLSIFNFVLFFSIMGLPTILIPWITNKKDVSSVFYFLFIINIIFMIIGIIISINHIWLLPLVVILPFILLGQIANAILSVEYKYHLVRFFNFLLIIVTLISVFLLRDLDKLGMILGYAMGYLIFSLGVIFLTRIEIFKIISNIKLDYPTIKEYIKKAIAVSIVSVSFSFIGWIDSIILGNLSTFENVAWYNVASPIANLITIIPVTISLFLLTRSSELKDLKTSINVLARTVRLSYLFSLILAILIASSVNLVINLFFPKYNGVEIYIIILSIGMLFFTFWALFGTYLAGRLKSEKAIFPIFSAALLNLFLDIILIPKYGLYGICIATLLAHIMAFTLLSIKLNFIKKFILVYPLSFLVLLAYYLGYYGLLLIPVIIPILFLTKLITIDDIKVVKDTAFSIIKLK